MNTLMLTKSPFAPTPAPSAQAARQREVDNALLVQALCERQPSPGVLARLMRYVTGELNREQAFAELYAGMR
ncbi:MAG: hypothetical protein EOO60_12100 [Hymenobacter sp.]|nr:MAG: hypothetical protein EOO60_12100 [Hymenobacter sp.]